MKPIALAEMVQLVSKRTGFLPCDCRLFLESYYDIVCESLKSGRSVHIGKRSQLLGRFEVLEHMRPWFNMKTGKLVKRDVPRKRLNFSPTRRFNDEFLNDKED